jgi:hypothetical protein
MAKSIVDHTVAVVKYNLCSERKVTRAIVF